jgi:hypothetical protein
MENSNIPKESRSKLEALLQRTFGLGCRIRKCSDKEPIYAGYFCPISRTIKEIARTCGIDITHIRYVRCAIYFHDVSARGWISDTIRIDEGFIKGYYQSHDKRMLFLYVTVNGKQEYMIVHNTTGMPPYATKKHFYSNPEEYIEVLLEEKVPVKLMRYVQYRENGQE